MPSDASETATNNAFYCPICDREYGRVDHLQRHLDTHSSIRPFKCLQCGKSYRRRDVLARHHQNCTPSSGLPQKQNATPARKSNRRSCDRCVKQKKACSNSHPCSNCSAQKLRCTYPPEVNHHHRQDSVAISDAEVDFPDNPEFQYPPLNSNTSVVPAENLGYCQLPLSKDHSSGLPQHDMFQDQTELEGFATSSENAPLDSSWQNMLLDNLGSDSRLTTNRDPALHFQFLIGYAKNRGLADTFEVGKFSSAAQQTSPCRQPPEEQDYGLGLSTGKVTPEANPKGLCQFTQDRTLTMPFATGDPNLRTLCNDPLLMKTMEICTGLKTTLVNKSVNSVSSMEWSPLTEAMAQQFFCPSNLRTFMERYWTLWHPHWPCIHKPTFRYHTTASTLLAVLVLTGASLSSQSQDRDNACIWFDVVEEWVFNDTYVSSVGTGRDGQYLSEKDEVGKIQALQATCGAFIYQYWQGRESAKTRVRRVRFNVLVGIMRDIGAANAQHAQVPPFSQDRFDWREFLRTEVLIRLMTFVYAIDTGLTIWHNTPPRLVLRELEMGLACPELCFQTESPAECVDKLNSWRSCFPYRSGETLYSVIRTFCKPKLPDEDKLRLPYCSLLSLWAVVKAFYVMVFTLDTTIGPDAHMRPILSGLENWKIVWNCRLNNGGDDAFDVPLADNVAGTIRSTVRSGGQCLGFWRHAAEYWLLARILLSRKAAVDPEDHSVWNPLSGTDIDLSWIFAPSPFDRYDQNAYPKLLKFLQREQLFENNMRQYSL